jgi:hypothetical protein
MGITIIIIIIKIIKISILLNRSSFLVSPERIIRIIYLIIVPIMRIINK